MRLKELRMDWRAITAIVVSTLAIILDQYHHLLGNGAYDGLLLYFLIPMLAILILFRESPARYGFQLGDWKAGLLLTVAGCAGMTLIMWGIARTGAFRNYYRVPGSLTARQVIDTGLDLFGWEFLFRGFLLFALYRICGPHAIVLQAVPFAIAHIGKPELETLSCIFGGSAFGYVAWRTRSFLYPFLIHWFLMTITVFFASGWSG